MFKTAPSLDQLLADFLKEAERDYPETKGRLCIFDLKGNRYHLSEGFKFKSRGFEDRRDFVRFLMEHESTIYAHEKDVRGLATKDAERDVLLLYINHDLSEGQRVAINRQNTIDYYHTLDHELAHLTIPAAYDTYDDSAHDTLLAENIAETYALLRHHQRCQENATPLKNTAIELAASLMMNDQSYRTHFYYPTIRTLQDLDLNAIRAMDIKTTSAFAEELARKHTSPQKNVDAILKATEKCRKTHAKEGIEAALPLLADVAFAGKADHITQMAVDVCLHYLDMPQLMLIGPQWAKLRQDLKEFDARLAKSELLAEKRQTVAAYAPTLTTTPTLGLRRQK